jgi:Bacterial membrane protein YfhO.
MKSRFIPRNVPRESKFRTWAAVAFIVALVLAAFWKLTVMRGLVITDDIFASDLMNENFPYRFSMGNALQSGHWPLWVREIYGGFPLLARSEAGVCYPFNIILFGFFSPYVALNLTILLIVMTAGVGMYFYTREIGASYVAGTLGGVAFGFSGYLLSHLKHLSMANGACWLPVGLVLLERAIKRNSYRSLLWFGVVFGLQHLAGNAQTAYYAGVLYVLYFALRLLNKLKELEPASKKSSALRSVLNGFRSRLTWSFIGMLVLATLLAAIQLIPTYELVSFTQRAGGVTFEYASNYAYDLKDFWTFFYPFSNGDIGNFTYSGKGVFWEDYGYVGVVTLLLAIYAPLRCWKSWHVRFFSISAVVSYIFVLGPATPVYKIVFDYVPGINYFRFPTRLLLVTDLSLVALAALGLTKIAGQLAAGAPRGSRRSSVVQATLLGAVVCDLLYFQLRQNPIVDAEPWMEPPKTVEILKQDPSLFRVFCVGGNHAHRRTFEQARGWEGDLQPFVDQREFIQPSSNVLYGIASPNGYANLTPNYIVDIWGDQNRAGIITQTASIQGDIFQPTPLFWKLMRMYNVKYLTSFWPFAPAPNLRPLGVYGGAYLYQNDELLPRAYVVGDVASVADGDTALRMLRSDGFDPARSVLLDAVPSNFQKGEGAGGNVEFLRYTTNEAEMRVRTPRNAILVFSDSYYPGWVADVDGSETTIHRANITQRAVVVPAGEHHVRFRFKPRTVVVGFWVSISSLALFVGLFLTPWARKKMFPGKTAHNNPLLV